MELLERERPLAQLDAHLAEASAGQGRLVLLSGEAGVGKSAIINAFTRRVASGVLRTSWDSLSTPAPLGPARDLATLLGVDLDDFARSKDAREGVFRAILTALESRRTPTVIVGEDAHWADGASLELLRFLGRRIGALPVLIIVSFRDDEIAPDHPLRILLGDLATAPTLHRVSLEPLSEDAVAELAAVAGRDPEGLHRLTNGNPFFVAEILAAAAGPVPTTVSDAVLARAARLSPEARSVLDVASVIGASFASEVFLNIAGPVLDEIDACIASGLLTAAGDDLQFRHALAREAIYGAMAPTRRRLLHARVLDALRREVDRGTVLARLAHHADLAGDRAAVLEYAAAAADEAARLNSNREAAAQYRRALRHAGGLAPTARARLFEGLSVASYLSDAGEEAVAARLAAVDLWRGVGNRLREAENLRWLARLYWFQGRGDEAEASLTEAMAMLEMLPPGPELAIACNTFAEIRMLDQDFAATLRWGQRAAELATPDSDPEIAVQALVNMGSVRSLFEDPAGDMELAEGLRLALAHGLTEQAARGLTNLACTTMWSMRLPESEKHFDAALTFTRDHDLDFFHRYVRAARAALWMRQGNWDAAIRESQQLLQMPELSPVTRILALTTVGQVYARRGQDEATALLDEALGLAETNGQFMRLGPVQAARAEAALQRGDLEQATATLGSVRDLVAKYANRWQRGQFAWLARQVGDHTVVTVDVAEPYLLQIHGEMEAAAEAWRLLGCPFEEAQALTASDDPSRVREALATFERLGAYSLRSAAAQRLRDLGSRDVPLLRRGPLATTRANPAGLTQREVEVLALVTEGLRNPEIAARLFLTPKTVSHHLTSIYAKLGVATRTEATRVASRLGIISQI